MARQPAVSSTKTPQAQLTVPPMAKSRVKAEHRYPVYNLADSVIVARTVRERGGGEATAEALAAYLNYSGTNNGAFLTRIGAAKLFGLIERQTDSYVPTARAMQILAPERPGHDDAVALADAFKEVPLFGVLLIRYRGQALPPETGLRNAMESQYGIPKGRTQLAYRVFMDSAETAGYFTTRGGARTHLHTPQMGSQAPHQAEVPAARGRELESHPPVEPQPHPDIRPIAVISTIIDRLQEALVEKIRDVPADDLAMIREYIREIKALEADKPTIST